MKAISRWYCYKLLREEKLRSCKFFPRKIELKGVQIKCYEVEKFHKVKFLDMNLKSLYCARKMLSQIVLCFC